MNHPDIVKLLEERRSVRSFRPEQITEEELQSIVRIITDVPTHHNTQLVHFTVVQDKALLDELPFHTSMYVTNMASIGMTRVYHHIYNFGNTSLFFSMGTPQRSNQPDMKGEISRKCILPIGITADERVCSGAIYAKLFAVMKHCLTNPYELEQPPEKVYYNEGCEFHEPKPGAAAEAQKAGASV